MTGGRVAVPPAISDSRDSRLDNSAMRASLFDLIIAIAFTAIPVMIVAWLFPPKSQFEAVVTMVVWPLVSMVVFWLPTSSFLYRRLQIRPMYLPKCPACRDANRHYFTVSMKWPQERIECAICQQQIDLQLDRSDEEPSQADVPSFRLFWPYSFGGRWQRVLRLPPASILRHATRLRLVRTTALPRLGVDQRQDLGPARQV